jgi:phosphotransferase system HPr (HPr) family protein
MSEGASAEVTISNPQGMHLRPATEFARLVQTTGCAVRVKAGDSEANGASVLELAMMAAGPGTLLVISAEGEGCESAVASLVELVRNDFKH